MFAAWKRFGGSYARPSCFRIAPRPVTPDRNSIRALTDRIERAV